MSSVPPPPPPPPPPTQPPPPPNQPPPPMAPAPGSVGLPVVQYAGWWARVGAWIIDGLIAVVFLLPAIVVFMAGPREINFRSDGFAGPGLYEEPTAATMAIAALLYLAGFIAYLVFYCRMLGKGATVGRKVVGYRVLDERTMQPIGTGRAVGRYFAVILSAMPFYLGLLWPLWDKERRTFHDMIVRTRAIKN